MRININKILAVALLGVCFYFFDSYAYSDPEKENTKTARIGFIAPLTGPFAEWGTSLKNGMEIALRHSKHQFSVDYQDDVCDTNKALLIGKKFIDTGGISIIVGPGCQGGIEALGNSAQQNGVIFFSTGLLDDTIFKRFKNVLNFSTQISMEAQYVAKYLSTQDISKVGIIHGTNVFGEEFGKQLPKLFQRQNIQVVANEATALDTPDFGSIILRIMQKKPDIIFVHQAESQIGLIAKQLRSAGFKTPLFGYYGSQAQAVLKVGKAFLEGMKYTYPVNSADQSEQKRLFDAEYLALFHGNTPTASSYFVYDGMMILDKALDKCRVSDTECIRGYFQRDDGFTGISGFVRFEKDGSTTRPFGIKQIKNGQFEWVERSL